MLLLLIQEKKASLPKQFSNIQFSIIIIIMSASNLRPRQATAKLLEALMFLTL